MTKLDKANNLRTRIEELRNFLFAVDPIKGREDRNSVALRVRTVTEFSLFGSRFYGWGRSESELKIPQPLVEVLKVEAGLELNRLEKELDEMFKEVFSKDKDQK